MTRTPAVVRQEAGARVRLARQRRGLTVRQLAAGVHVSPATVTAIEHGRTSITLERLDALASVLAVSAADLLGASTDEAPAREQSWREFGPLELDAALAGAARVFVGTGYHGATMRAIAHAAGVSPAGIYHHYGSKHDLLRELMLRGMVDLVWRVERAAEGTTGTTRLARVVEAMALWHAHRFEIALIGASEMRSLDAAAHRQVVQRRRQVQRLLDDAVLGSRPDGADLQEGLGAARAVATMCTSIPQWFAPDGEMSPEQVAEQQARFALLLCGHGHVDARPLRRDGAA